MPYLAMFAVPEELYKKFKNKCPNRKGSDTIRKLMRGYIDGRFKVE